MEPTVRYDLRPGEWRPDPPHVAYGCDRSGLVGLLEAELGAAPWARDHPRAGGEHDRETVRRPALQSAPSPPVPDGCCPCRTSSRPGSRSRADQRAQTGRETVRERVLERSMSHGRPTRHRPCSGCRAPSCRRWPPARPLVTLRRMSAGTGREACAHVRLVRDLVRRASFGGADRCKGVVHAGVALVHVPAQPPCKGICLSPADGERQGCGQQDCRAAEPRLRLEEPLHLPLHVGVVGVHLVKNENPPHEAEKPERLVPAPASARNAFLRSSAIQAAQAADALLSHDSSIPSESE